MATPINFLSLKPGYERDWATMVVRPEKADKVKSLSFRIQTAKHEYEYIVQVLHVRHPQSAVPWYFVGLLHLMECNLSFRHHLHNGDPLIKRTTHVPAGRPVAGKPPFTFVDSALDALVYQGLHTATDWSIPKILNRLEAYNGFGYRKYYNMNSPYLWAGSNLYTKGKYTADGHFDPNAVSTQIGTALILRELI